MVWDSTPSQNLEEIYSEEYFVNDNPKGGYANYFEGMNVNRRTFFERIKRINKKTIAKERMLDVGCALGDSLIEAKKLGWKSVKGVELSSYAVTIAKKKGLDVSKSTLKLAKFPSDYFDVVTMQDVIEHIPDPKKEMEEIYRILKPGGIVFLVTPDIDGGLSKLLKKFWYHYKPNEHIIYFSKKTLQKLINDVGFKDASVRSAYHVMSVEYIFNRLRYYFPSFFKLLLKLVSNNFLGQMSFRIYAGEIEGWGRK